MDIVACANFDGKVLKANFYRKTIFTRAVVMLVINDGGKNPVLKLYANDIGSIELVDEEQISSDGAQRARNAAIGVVLLGPVGLLGAAMGGAKKSFKLRFTTKSNQVFIVDAKEKEATEIFKELANMDFNQAKNEKFLKSA